MSNIKENWNTAPYFQVPNIKQAAEYYRDKLGFVFEEYWGDPPDFTMVNRGGTTIMLSELHLASKYLDLINPNQKRDHHAWDAYIWINTQSLDALFVEFQKNGATIVSKPSKKEFYGMYEMEIMDPFGYVIAFGQDLSSLSE